MCARMNKRVPISGFDSPRGPAGRPEPLGRSVPHARREGPVCGRGCRWFRSSRPGPLGERGTPIASSMPWAVRSCSVPRLRRRSRRRGPVQQMRAGEIDAGARPGGRGRWSRPDPSSARRGSDSRRRVSGRRHEQTIAILDRPTAGHSVVVNGRSTWTRRQPAIRRGHEHFGVNADRRSSRGRRGPVSHVRIASSAASVHVRVPEGPLRRIRVARPGVSVSGDQRLRRAIAADAPARPLHGCGGCTSTGLGLNLPAVGFGGR